MRQFILLTIFILPMFCTAPASAGAPAGYDANQSWQDALSDIKEIQKGLSTGSDISSKLFDPATNEGVLFYTMDGATSFSATIGCQTRTKIVEVSATPASNGEVNVTIKYDAAGNGSFSSVTIPNVAGACTGGAVYDCQPSGSWSNCKYGVLEFSGGVLGISYTLPSGAVRPAEGMQGCFCFSNHCGGTAGIYMQNILTHMGSSVAGKIAANRGNLVLSDAEYDPATQVAVWYSGDAADCQSGYSIDDLTSQYGKLDFDYQSAIDAQEEGSAWDIVTQHVQQQSNQFVCEQNARVSVEYTLVERSLTTDYGIGYDANGSSEQCYWFTASNGCGAAWGEPNNWDACLQMSSNKKAGICHNLWVSGGYFTSITNVTNDRAVSGVAGVGSHGGACYGADGSDPSQYWQMTCHGMKYADKFVCRSSGKTEPGVVILNSPYDSSKYDGCEEIHPVEDNCSFLAQREDCRLVKEVTDGVITISNGAVTTARALRSCKSFSGTHQTITVCEPWWKRTRTYECTDTTDDFDQLKKRNQYISGSISLDENNSLATVGDLTFDSGGTGLEQVIDMQLVFEKSPSVCEPACVVQREVPNYEVTLPGQGKIASDGSYHVDEAELSVVPQGTRLILDTLDCELANNVYTCPVPEGWSLRAQCSCADGQEFAQVIASLSVINEVSKDYICSTGEEQGMCAAEDEGQEVYSVVCGNFPPAGSTTALVLGENFWECFPRLWTGLTPAPQTHQAYLSEDYICMGGSPDLNASGDIDPFIEVGMIQPQKSWFTPVITWASDKIREYLSGRENYWGALDGCDCGSLDTDEIPVCAATTDNSATVCLSTNAQYADMASCMASCEGRATQGANQICIWRDTVQTGYIPATYQLGVYPNETAVFGEVFLNANFQATVGSIDSLPVCVDETVDEVAVPFQEGAECVGSTQQKTLTTNAFEVYWGFTVTEYTETDYCYGVNADKSCGKNYGYWKSETFNRCYNLLYNDSNIAGKCQNFVTNGQLDSITSFYTAQTNWSQSRCCGNAYTKCYYGSYVLYCTGNYTTYMCPTSGGTFTDKNACNSACVKTRYRCEPSGRIVDTPEECYVPIHRCTGTGNTYTTAAACSASCSFTGVTGGSVCNSNTGQESFVAYLKEASASYGFDQELLKLPPDGAESGAGREFIAEAAYEHTDLILNQCLRQYTEPYIKFDEPGTNAHFEYSMMDKMVYHLAAQRGELPAVSGEIPDKPAVYRGSAMRQIDIALKKLWDEEVDAAGNIIKVPNATLTDEERAAILAQVPGISFDEDGAYSVSLTDQAKMVPRQPMFLTKSLATQERSQTEGGRAGMMGITASSGLTSSVYYYECPQGVTNDTAQCGQKAPYGGLADTIAGQKCFQYFCDDDATVENTTTQYSGCGLINDGTLVPSQ